MLKRPAEQGKTSDPIIATTTFRQQQHPDRLSEHSPTAVLSTDRDANNNNNQSIRLFSLLAPPFAPNSMSSSPSSPSMLLPPAALFPILAAGTTATAATAATLATKTPVGSKRQKAGLFSKIKKKKKHLLDDHRSTSTGTNMVTTSTASIHPTKGLKGPWTGPSSIFRRVNNDSTASSHPHPYNYPQPTATVTQRKVGTSLQFGQFRQLWRFKDTADPKPLISTLPSSNSSNSDNNKSRTKAVVKKSNWLSIRSSPLSAPTTSALPFPNDHNSQQCQQHHTLLQRQRSRTTNTFAVQDVFGIGKMSEMAVALFLAHDCFLCRKPLWLQCAIMLWEGVVVLMVLWAVLRVIGLAEVIVWGADDIVRGSVSVFQAIGHAIRILFWR